MKLRVLCCDKCRERLEFGLTESEANSLVYHRMSCMRKDSIIHPISTFTYNGTGWNCTQTRFISQCLGDNGMNVKDIEVKEVYNLEGLLEYLSKEDGSKIGILPMTILIRQRNCRCKTYRNTKKHPTS